MSAGETARIAFLKQNCGGTLKNDRPRQLEHYWSLVDLLYLHGDKKYDTGYWPLITSILDARLHGKPGFKTTSDRSGRTFRWITLDLFDQACHPQHVDNKYMFKPQVAAYLNETGVTAGLTLASSSAATPSANGTFDVGQACDITYRYRWLRTKFELSNGRYRFREHLSDKGWYALQDLVDLHGEYTTRNAARMALEHIRQAEGFTRPQETQLKTSTIAGGAVVEYVTLDVFDRHYLRHIRTGVAPIITQALHDAGKLVEQGSQQAINLARRNQERIWGLIQEDPTFATIVQQDVSPNQLDASTSVPQLAITKDAYDGRKRQIECWEAEVKVRAAEQELEIKSKVVDALIANGDKYNKDVLDAIMQLVKK